MIEEQYRKNGLIPWMQREGIAKDEKTAQYILLGFVVLCFGIAGLMIFRQLDDKNNSSNEALSEYEILQLPENDFRRINFDK